MRYLKRSKRQAIARGKEINISSKAFLANNCNPLEALEAERDEARQVARRMMRERDEARNSLKVYEENLVDANREVNRLDFIRDTLAAENAKLRQKLEGANETTRQSDIALRNAERARDEAVFQLSKKQINHPDVATMERNQACVACKRIAKERDEAQGAVETQTATIQHLESDRDALAAENKRLADETVDAWNAVGRLRERNAVLTDLCTTIETERMQLRKALEQNVWIWWPGNPELPEEYARWICIYCRMDKPNHAPDCPRQVALGLAKGDIAPNTSLETQLRDEIDALEAENAELRRVIEIPKWGGWNTLPVCPWCLNSGIHSYNCERQKVLGLKL